MLASLGSSLCKSLLSRTAANNSLIQIEILSATFHTSTVDQSRIKRSARHKAFWHAKKLNKADDSPLTDENKQFLQSYIDKKYSGPLKEEFAPWSRGKWEPGSRRPGVLAVKIGVQPLWLKNGKQIVTTMLHIQDNHVVKYTPRDKYDDSYVGELSLKPKYATRKPVLMPGKKANVTGFVTVGAVSSDPQKYTKDYCGLFSQSGLAPKRFLARFPVTENAIIQPGTPLSAAHFRPGQFVDVYGRTMERGFQGVMKRWGFHGMPATHGVTKSHRRPGCIGSGRDKGRVWPGQKLPGHVGGIYRWYRGIRIWRINYEENVLYVSGPSIQGATGSVLQVCDTKLYAKRFENNKKLGMTDGPKFFPTAYPDQTIMLPALRVCAVRANNPAIVRLMSDAPQRFGHANGDSGWRWEKNGVGMGGKEAGPATEIKEGLGKDYPNQQFFKYDKYSYFDVEKDVVESGTRKLNQYILDQKFTLGYQCFCS